MTIGHALRTAALAIPLLGCGCVRGQSTIHQHAPTPPSSSASRSDSQPSEETPIGPIAAYDVELTLLPATQSLEGQETLTFVPLASPLRIDTHDIEILRTEVLQGKGSVKLGNRSLEVADVQSLRIQYRAVRPKGLTIESTYAYTKFFACHWMICDESPGHRSALTLTLVMPSNWSALGAGALRDRVNQNQSAMRISFSEPRPYPSYVFGFAAGAYQTENRVAYPHHPKTLACLPLTARSDVCRPVVDAVYPMLDFFGSKAGVPFPHDTYAHVIVDGSEAQEASHFSLVGTDEVKAMVDDPTEDWAVAHELAHQWWGNVVTCSDWSHFWLNEGMAVFMTAAWKEHRWGKAKYDREIALARERWQRARESGWNPPLTYAGDHPTLKLKRAIVYSKAAVFLATLRATMGEEAFWEGVRRYTLRRAWKSTSSSDFQNAMQETTATDLRALFAEWVGVAESNATQVVGP